MTAAVEWNTSSGSGCPRGEMDPVDVRIWCFDCYDRREPWVLAVLGDHGVGFRHVVLEAEGVCRSCRAELPLGLHAIRVTIPLRIPRKV